MTPAFTDFDDTLDAPLAEPEPELDRAALERLWPADEWLSRVGATPEERVGYVPRPRETGPRGRCSATRADVIAGALHPART